jgi:hypothetical protein
VRAKQSAILALLLIAAFMLALPYLELLDSQDLVVTGQDFEIDILNVLTIFGIWSVLILRLLAFLPDFRTRLRALIRSPRIGRLVARFIPVGIFLLRKQLGSPPDLLPLLI